MKVYDSNPDCKDALTTTISKDRYIGDKKRNRCIAIDADNEDVNECYYENIVPSDPNAENVNKKVLVWVDGRI